MSAIDREGNPFKDLVTLALGFGLLFFQFLGRLPLIDPDEGRYIEIPREMLERGDWITPTLNYVKYFEKPPLHYWLNALSLLLFGENEFAARFAGTLCGLLTVLLTYHLGRKLYGRDTGFWGAIILGTAGGFLVQSRINFTDMTLTFCLSTAFACFVLATRSGGEAKARYYYLFYAFMGLSVLAKGLIGIVLPGAVIFCYLLLGRKWQILKQMRLFSGGLLFLAICAPWFVLVSLKNPEFPQFFFIHEHFQRFLTKVHHRYQPFWFFLPVLLGTMLPWSLFLPAALARGWRERQFRPETLFLVLWAAVVFAFFSKSNSKLIPYILPVFPPLALLSARWFLNLPGRVSVRRHGFASAALLTLVGTGVILYPQLFAKSDLSTTDGAIVGGCLVLQGLAAAWAARSGAPITLLSTLAVTGYLFALVAPPVVYQRVAERNSVRPLARALNARLTPGARIACYNNYEQGIAFYTHQRVMMVGDPDELGFGSRQGDHSAWFLDHDRFHRLWDSGAPLFLTIKRRELQQFSARVKTQPQVVAATKSKLLLTNHPVAP